MGDLFDEVVPSSDELNNYTQEMERFLPESCGHLFHAYHVLFKKRDDQQVPITDWIKFWCNVPKRYDPPPSRKKSQTKRRLSRTHNPTGVLPRAGKWEENVRSTFAILNIEGDSRRETYLAAFISCWLCLFVLPSRHVGQIRPGVFKMACFMARGTPVGLAIPVLSSIYRGLNAIAKSGTPGKARAPLPFHYVHGWMVSYFNTHYATPTELPGPPMVKSSGEGGARWFDAASAYKRIHNGCMTWSPNLLVQREPFCFVDGGANSWADTS